MSELVDVLTAIYKKHGRLVDEDVVAESTPEDAPLHHRFDWDNDSAAHQHRLSTARHLIRSAHIRYVGPDSPEAKEVRAFVSVRQSVDPAKTGYLPVGEVMSDPVATRLLLNELERAIKELKLKYGHLVEFSEIVRRNLSEAAA